MPCFRLYIVIIDGVSNSYHLTEGFFLIYYIYVINHLLHTVATKERYCSVINLNYLPHKILYKTDLSAKKQGSDIFFYTFISLIFFINSHTNCTHSAKRCEPNKFLGSSLLW